MDVLLESPLAVAAIGAVFVAMAAVGYFQTRSRAALGAVALALLLTGGAVAYERWHETPREAVRTAVGDLFAAIEANDLAGVLRTIDPAETAGVRADAETLMPMLRIESAGQGGDIGVEISGAAARVTLKPMIRVQHTASGTAGAYFDELTIDFVRRGDRWLVEGYEPATDWRSGAARLSR